MERIPLFDHEEKIGVFYDGPIISYKEAKAQGLSRYFTGEACRYHHIAQRYTSICQCCECTFVRNGYPNLPLYYLPLPKIEITPHYNGPIITRKQAINLGLTRYYTGSPCKHGHIAQRNTSDGRCCQCAIIKTRIAYRSDKNIAKRAEQAQCKNESINQRIKDSIIYYYGPLISRKEAKDQGLTRFFDGKPCKYNHIDQKWTVNGRCCKCTTLNAILHKNTEKRKASNERYRKSAKGKARQARSYYSESGKAWWENYRDSDERKTTRNRYSNSAKGKATSKASHQRRRANEYNASGIFTAADWVALLARSPNCYWCDQPWTEERRPTHDHIIPLSKRGSNTPENSVASCLKCNLIKGDRLFHPITGQGLLI
jgi:hypothetical protein